MDNLIIKLIFAAILTAVISGSSSHLMTISKTVMLSLSLLHAVLAGSLIGIYMVHGFSIPVPMQITALIFTILIAILAAELVERGLSSDAAIGIIAGLSTTIIATFGYLDATLSPIAVSEAWSYVAGLSAVVRNRDIALLTIILTIIVPITLTFEGEFIYIAFDEDGAKAMGLRVRLYRYLLYSLCAIVAASLSMSLGVFVSHVVIVVPGVLALKIGSKHLHIASLATSTLCMTAGYITAYTLHLPPSSGVGIMATILLTIAYIVRK